MKAGLSGSGVRYVSIGEPKLVWHTKGIDGFLAHDDAECRADQPERATTACTRPAKTSLPAPSLAYRLVHTLCIKCAAEESP